MPKLNDDERRALETLAHQDGCAEAVLLADGFSIDQLAGLVVGGYAVMQRRRVEISGRERTVVWVQITDAGRQATGSNRSAAAPHACGYALANKGHDTRAIQGWLGHRSITSTAVYTALAPNRFKDFLRE